jgi:hypothetical protein
MATLASVKSADVAFTDHTEPKTLAKNAGGDWVATWKAVTPLHKTAVNIDLLSFYAAVVRTSAASAAPSPMMTKATGCLAGALSRFVRVSPTGTLEVSGEYTELKDFVRTGLTGVAGAGLAYLHMLEDGYTWCAHYEDCVPPKKEKRPDFVFSKPAQAGSSAEYVLLEAKGTQHLTSDALTRAQKGFLAQVLPRADKLLKGTFMPTHGYASAVAFNSVKPTPPAKAGYSKVTFVIAGQKFPAPTPAKGSSGSTTSQGQGPTVQSLNYTGFFQAAGAARFLTRKRPGQDDFVSDAIGVVDTPFGEFSIRLVIPRPLLDDVREGKFPEPDRGRRPEPVQVGPSTLDVRFPDHTIVRFEQVGDLVLPQEDLDGPKGLRGGWSP